MISPKPTENNCCPHPLNIQNTYTIPENISCYTILCDKCGDEIVIEDGFYHCNICSQDYHKNCFVNSTIKNEGSESEGIEQKINDKLMYKS